MSISYSFSLCMGFEVAKEDVLKVFKRSETTEYPGEFHMEDRFDPKTGAKIIPVKIWDRAPSNTTNVWYECGDCTWNDSTHPDEITAALEEKFDCYIGQYGDYSAGSPMFVFQVNAPISYREAMNLGRITIYNNSVPVSEVLELAPHAYELKEKLCKAKIYVGEPKIFIATCIS